MVFGSHPVWAKAITRAKGLSPRFATSSPEASNTAAAESLIPLAFPGVTVPSLMKHARSLPRLSTVVPNLKEKKDRQQIATM
jgi:hypothetical protein